MHVSYRCCIGNGLFHGRPKILIARDDSDGVSRRPRGVVKEVCRDHDIDQLLLILKEQVVCPKVASVLGTAAGPKQIWKMPKTTRCVLRVRAALVRRYLSSKALGVGPNPEGVQEMEIWIDQLRIGQFGIQDDGRQCRRRRRPVRVREGLLKVQRQGLRRSCGPSELIPSAVQSKIKAGGAVR